MFIMYIMDFIKSPINYNNNVMLPIIDIITKIINISSHIIVLIYLLSSQANQNQVFHIQFFMFFIRVFKSYSKIYILIKYW